MKKVYSRPEIAFESFTLSTNIAGCMYSTSLPSYEQGCGWESEEFGVVLFASSLCEYAPPTDYDEVCYHNPSLENNIFGS